MSRVLTQVEVAAVRCGYVSELSSHLDGAPRGTGSLGWGALPVSASKLGGDAASQHLYAL